MKIFYVVYVENGPQLACLEAIRLLCSPSEKHPAHITVRGPYKRRINTKKINQNLVGNTVAIYEVANFFQFGQNTVYFKCVSTRLSEVWRKKDFPSFNPHITIYDGTSKKFSRELFDIVSQYSYDITLRADALMPMLSVSKQRGIPFQMSPGLRLISEIHQEHLNPENINELSLKCRLSIINKICNRLSAAKPNEIKDNTLGFHSNI